MATATQRRRAGAGAGGLLTATAAAAATLLPLLLLLALTPQLTTAASTDQGVDVCPAATFKSLPFLKSAKPDALDALLPTSLSGGFALDQAAITEFVKTTLVPLIGANVFFFVLSVLLLIIFLLWRLLRWCFHVLCCSGSCDARREANDPAELLFGRTMRALKGVMFILCLASAAFAVYGLATVPKNVTDQAFAVVQQVNDYVGGALDVLDSLLAHIGGVPAIVDDLQLIVTRDIDVDGFASNLTAVGTFLGAVPAPATVSTQVSGLSTRLADLTAALTALQSGPGGLAGFAAGPETVFTAALSTVANAVASKFSDFAGKANAVEADLADGVWAIAGGPGAADATLTTIQGHLNAVDLAAWATDLTAIRTALQGASGVGTLNPYATLQALLQSVKTIATDITGTRVPALAGDVNALSTQYAAVLPALGWLLNQLVTVNATVIALPPSMADAYGELNGAKTDLDALFALSPTPAALAASLATFSSSPSLQDLTSVNALLAALATPVGGLASAFPPASVTTYAGVVTVVLNTVASLSAPSVAAGPLGALKTALATYLASGTAGDWAALTAAKAAAQPLLLVLAGTGGLDNSVLGGGGIAGTFATNAAAAPWNAWAPGSFAAATTSAGTFASAAQAQLGTAPSLAALGASMGSAATSYAALGTPASAVVDAPKAQLATIKAAALTSGDAVKQQVTGMVAAFTGSTASVRATITSSLGGIKPRYGPLAAQVDAYRYQASMALFGVSVLFVLLLLASALANYHFGAQFSTCALLVVTTLYLLLAAIFALALSALFMGCGEVEPLALRLAPAAMAPLLRYYFYAEGASFSAVLKDANLIDIDAVLAQATAGQSQVIAGITGTFSFRPGPAAVIASINTTIDAALADVDALLGKASREQLFPLYSDVKGLVCCAVPDVLGVHWTALTFAGVLAVAGALAAFFYLGRIDRAPRRDCCGCTCHTRAKYAGTVVFPGSSGGGGVLPQYATGAGFDHGGAYAPPHGAMAMSLPWNTSSEGGGGGEAAAHVVIAPRGASATAKKGHH